MNVTDTNTPQTPAAPMATDQPATDMNQPIAPGMSENTDGSTGGNKDEMLWATLSHAGTFAGFIIPFGHVIVPLAIYLIKKEESAYIAEHAKESLNFQISLSIYSVVAFILTLVFIGVILGLVLLILWIVFVIQASMAANKGQSYRYPMTFRFVK